MGKTEDHIKEIIRLEIKGDLYIFNLHGVDLRKCLVEPHLETLEDSFLLV